MPQLDVELARELSAPLGEADSRSDPRDDALSGRFSSMELWRLVRAIHLLALTALQSPRLQ